MQPILVFLINCLFRLCFLQDWFSTQLAMKVGLRWKDMDLYCSSLSDSQREYMKSSSNVPDPDSWLWDQFSVPFLGWIDAGRPYNSTSEDIWALCLMNMALSPDDRKKPQNLMLSTLYSKTSKPTNLDIATLLLCLEFELLFPHLPKNDRFYFPSSSSPSFSHPQFAHARRFASQQVSAVLLGFVCDLDAHKKLVHSGGWMSYRGCMCCFKLGKKEGKKPMDWKGNVGKPKSKAEVHRRLNVSDSSCIDAYVSDSSFISYFDPFFHFSFLGPDFGSYVRRGLGAGASAQFCSLL